MKMKKSLTILATFAAAISAQAADDSLVLDATISDSVSYENRLALGGSNATLLITSTGELSTPQGILIQGNNVTIDVAAGGKILTKSILMYQGGTMKIKFGDATSIMNEDGTKGTIFTNRKSQLTFDLSAVKNASAMTIGTVSTTPLSTVKFELGSGTYTAEIKQNYDWNAIVPDSAKQLIEIDNFENNKISLTGTFTIVERESASYLRFTLTESEVNNIRANTSEGQAYLDAHQNEDGTYFADSTLLGYDAMGNKLASGWSIDANGFLYNAAAVPEPAEWAAIFGAVALLLAACRRRG